MGLMQISLGIRRSFPQVQHYSESLYSVGYGYFLKTSLSSLHLSVLFEILNHTFDMLCDRLAVTDLFPLIKISVDTFINETR